jgi:hypothetical protein
LSLIPFRHGSIVVGLASVDCPTATVCYALSQQSDDGVVLLKSTTGAARWFKVSITNERSGSQDDALTAQFSDVSCATTRSCAFVGVSQGGHLLIIQTTNGGATWHWSTKPGPPRPGPDQPDFAPAVSCASRTVCAVTDGSRLLYTSDAGAKWIAFLEPKSDGLMSSISCPTESECFLTTALSLSVKLQSEGVGAGNIVSWRR